MTEKQAAATHSVTDILRESRAGDAGARSRLLSLLYEELHHLAEARVALDARGLTLQPTTLLHESYLRIVGAEQILAEDRRQFFAYASKVMRNIIIDHARRLEADKRGGGRQRVTLTTGIAETSMSAGELVELDEALAALAELEPQLHDVVEMRFFGGLGYEEIAAVLGTSERTVKRYWDKARAFMFQALTDRG